MSDLNMLSYIIKVISEKTVNLLIKKTVMLLVSAFSSESTISPPDSEKSSSS